jgi:hypothetical protein
MSGQRTSAFRYLLHTGAVSLAALRAHTVKPNLLGHVNCPDARAAAHVEDARLPVLRNRRLVQAIAPRDGEHFVVDVHAVLLGLRTSVSGSQGRQVQVGGGGSPRRTGTCRCLSGSHDTSGRVPCSCCSEQARADCGRALVLGRGGRVAQSGDSAALTHLMPS